jgi:hypothetical protein
LVSLRDVGYPMLPSIYLGLRGIPSSNRLDDYVWMAPRGFDQGGRSSYLSRVRISLSIRPVLGCVGAHAMSAAPRMPNTSGSADLETVAGLDISQHRCAKLKNAVIITARLVLVVNEEISTFILKY